MLFEVDGTRSLNGKRVRMRVEARSIEEVISWATARGVVVDPAAVAKYLAALKVPEIKISAPVSQEVGGTIPCDIEAKPLIPIEPHTGGVPKPDAAEGAPAAAQGISFTGSTGGPSAQHPSFGRVYLIASVSGFAGAVLATLLVLGVVAAIRPSSTGTGTVESDADQLQRMSGATLRAWNQMVRVEQDILSKCATYSEDCAEAMIREYVGVALEGTDADFRIYLTGLVEAAESLVESEKERRAELWELDMNQESKARSAALAVGEKAAEGGETFLQQLGRGVVGAALGAGAAALDTELERKNINEHYDARSTRASYAIKERRDSLPVLLEKMKQRYGWRTK